MPIYKGLTKIGNINKGTTPIANVYKGAVLVYSSAKWLSYGFTNLYNSLIPTTIQSRNVLDKLKISKVYGNSVVENQLVKNGNFANTSDWAGTNGSISVSSNVLSYTITSIGGDLASNRLDQVLSTLANHKYLVKVKIKCPYNTTIRTYIGGFNVLGTAIANTWTELSLIVSTTNNLGQNNLYFDIYNQSSYQIGDTIQIKEYIKTDLTQMYPFDTPTTLTDVRVQALLNRGYIEYNTGELKSVDISEFSSEPYNLFDPTFEIGTINQTTGENESGSSTIRTKNYMYVPIGNEYTIKTIDNYNAVRIFEYDKNKNFIQTSVAFDIVVNYTLNTNTKYVRFVLAVNSVPSNPTIYLYNRQTAGDLGYKPHTQPHTLPFIYQGNGAGTSHDTFEITNSEYVFTKNMGSVDLGTLDYIYNSSWGVGGVFYSTQLNLYITGFDDNTQPNMLCSKYICVSRNTTYNSTNNSLCLSGAGSSRYITVRDTSYTDTTTFKNAMSGIYAYYQLATPQTIRIPKKHLGIVDMGSLNWQKESYTYQGNSIYRFKAQVNGIKIITSTSTIWNIYCEKYITDTAGHSFQQTLDKMIALDTNSFVVVNDSSYTDATTFKNAMNGIYLFYETESEVDDIEDMIKVEAGGTITSDSNVLPNVDTVIKCK